MLEERAGGFDEFVVCALGQEGGGGLFDELWLRRWTEQSRVEMTWKLPASRARTGFDVAGDLDEAFDEVGTEVGGVGCGARETGRGLLPCG